MPAELCNRENEVEDDEEEFEITGECTEEDDKFDRIVGALEDIVIGDDFQQIIAGFCKKNCDKFEDVEENKLCHMDLFKKYSELTEAHLEKKLKAAIPDFAMKPFLEELEQRGENEIAGDVLELLVSLADFETFKQQMLTQKVKSDGVDLCISGSVKQIHKNKGA
eukprot:gnl/TRDRNA2_/TRDRNA2_179964_c0_seq1.p2 gnl/TRDRNA2_/TRDRNA2_179964_c0~~gnl/TRDRNA2_/TRDRNA2_179964_c0_seq1.p2  ORF type:complete len:165 (+),score=71.48 gnl/TRDRNA2_/TRDRNA2_179964_c0_seq1:89-583(+)